MFAQYALGKFFIHTLFQCFFQQLSSLCFQQAHIVYYWPPEEEGRFILNISIVDFYFYVDLNN